MGSKCHFLAFFAMFGSYRQPAVMHRHDSPHTPKLQYDTVIYGVNHQTVIYSNCQTVF